MRLRYVAACAAAALVAIGCAHAPRDDAPHVSGSAPAPRLLEPRDVVASEADHARVAAAAPHLRPLGVRLVPCAWKTRRVSVWEDARNGLEFALVPAGSFTAGAADDGLGTFADAAPKTVSVAAPFLVCTTELTVGAARAVGLQRFKDEADDLPATRIDHGEALTICALLGYDLPTEDEWEWAARGAIRDGARCGPPPEPTTGPALRRTGTGEPNALGLLDVLGSAFEWCRDRTSVAGITGLPVRGGAHDSESWRLHPARRDVVADGMELAPNVGFRPVIRLTPPRRE